MSGAVVHCKRKPFDVYIGRPGPWGNPFVIGTDGTRAEVIAKYEAWLMGRADLLSQVPTLRGKVLAAGVRQSHATAMYCCAWRTGRGQNVRLGCLTG